MVPLQQNAIFTSACPALDAGTDQCRELSCFWSCIVCVTACMICLQISCLRTSLLCIYSVWIAETVGTRHWLLVPFDWHWLVFFSIPSAVCPFCNLCTTSKTIEILPHSGHMPLYLQENFIFCKTKVKILRKRSVQVLKSISTSAQATFILD